MNKSLRKLNIAKRKAEFSFPVHLTADFYSPKQNEDPKAIRRILYEAARAANNTPLKSVIHKFPVHGITGVILLAESHIALHTWPEYKYMAVDIFTCGKKTKPIKALEYLKSVFRPKKVITRYIKRGLL